MEKASLQAEAVQTTNQDEKTLIHPNKSDEQETKPSSDREDPEEPTMQACRMTIRRNQVVESREKKKSLCRNRQSGTVRVGESQKRAETPAMIEIQSETWKDREKARDVVMIWKKLERS